MSGVGWWRLAGFGGVDGGGGVSGVDWWRLAGFGGTAASAVANGFARLARFGGIASCGGCCRCVFWLNTFKFSLDNWVLP